MVSKSVTQEKMADTVLTEKLSKVEKLFEEIRDKLFECSLEAAKGNETDWQKAEALFKLAKNTDALRLSMSNFVVKEQSNSEITDQSFFEGGKESPIQSEGSLIAVTPAPKTARKKKGDYPKYSVRGDLLIKIGLSLDRKSEYEHVVPQKV